MLDYKRLNSRQGKSFDLNSQRTARPLNVIGASSLSLSKQCICLLSTWTIGGATVSTFLEEHKIRFGPWPPKNQIIMFKNCKYSFSMKMYFPKRTKLIDALGIL